MGLLDSIIGGNNSAPSAAPAPALDPQYVDAIKGFEGYRDTPYWDYKQYTSGYGTKAAAPDEKIDQATAEQRLQAELGKAAAHVDSVNPNLPPGPRAALISLTYNAGPGWANSGLGDLVRSGDLQGAQSRLLEYNKAGGKVNEGLTARRQQEASWFGQPQPAQASPVSPPMALPQVAAQQPLRIAPTAPPIFPPAAPQPQQQAQAEPAPSYWQQFPADQAQTAPPMFSLMQPRRPQVDISKLRQALGNGGLFFRGRA